MSVPPRSRDDRGTAAARTIFVTMALAAGACVPAEIPSVPEPPSPVTRYPYLQAVDDTSAFLLWWREDTTPDTLRYWHATGADTTTVVVASPDTRRSARLTRLRPDSEVRYRLTAGGASETVIEHSFRTAPPQGAARPFRAVVFGDSGSGAEEQVRLATAMDTVEADLILHTGDIAYPFGSDFDFTHRHFRVYQRWLARVPFFPVPGNHDVLTDGARPYREAFVLPSREPLPDRFYYAVDWGTLRVVVLDSTHEEQEDPELDLTRESEQRAWLEEELARAAQDPGVRWIVVVLHHPPFSSAKGLVGHGSYEDLRAALTPLFDRYGVDLVLTGHDHTYERTHPIRDGEVAEDGSGTTYVVTGGGGGAQDFRTIVPEWFTAHSAVEYHYIVLSFADDVLTLEARDAEGRILDRHALRRARDDGAG